LAAETRTKTDHLSVLREAAMDIRRYGFFALMRRVEARAPELPRLGRARKPVDDIAQLAHSPSMDFPASTLDGIETGRNGRVRIRGHFLGLTGSMGALPLNLTEYAAYERRYAKSKPFGAFLDLISNRMLQFFYRAWADSQPAAQADRPRDDRFAAYLAALSGARDGAHSVENFAGLNRLHFAGLFASRRSAAVLQDAMAGVLGLSVTVREFIGRWRDVTPVDQTRLGDPAVAVLGQGALLGARVRVADDTVRLSVRTPGLAAYEALTPAGDRYGLAAEALAAFTPGHLDWELELEIEETAARGVTLGRTGRLGWSSWLKPRKGSGVRADARLRKPARAPAAQAV
jgi:type VI secretion system protein ImpH